jgi:CNT family concentrative nucleoside transporter
MPMWLWGVEAAWADGGSFVLRETTWLDRGMSVVGLFAFVGLCWLISEERSRIAWRPVLWGIGLQVILCSVVLVPWLSESLVLMSDAVGKLLSFAGEGATFVFQSVEPHQIADPSGELQFYVGMTNGISPPVKTFAFWVLPTIVFFSAFSSVLYHLGILQMVVRAIAWVMVRTLKTSGAETLCTAGNIFLGQTEAPLLVRPFIERMTRSELMAVMVGGFATIAVGVLGLYADVLKMIPSIGGHLVVASIISAPAAFVCAKLVVPEIGKSETAGMARIELPRSEGNLLQAIAVGATDGIKLAINVAAMLIAVVALVAMVNFLISFVPVTFCDGSGATTGYTCAALADGTVPQSHPLDLTRMLGWIFFPFALLMGIPWSEAGVAGELLGEKLVLTELIAYFDLGARLAEGAPPVLSERSAIISAYALCGFANFASIGIQIGGIGAMAPSRVKDLASLGLKAMAVGSIATCMTGAVVGIFI